MSKNGKTGKSGNSSIWAREASVWAMKVVDTAFESILFKFCDFLIFCWFWHIFIHFWLRNVLAKFMNFWIISNRPLAFLSQNRVKNCQNWQKFENSQNWEKMQFFDALNTFTAPKLDSPAQFKDWPYFNFFDFSVRKIGVFSGGF